MPEQPLLDDEAETKEDGNEEADDLTDKQLWWKQWEKWIERNGLPKKYKFLRVKRSLTRFQKRGPMSVNDWSRWVDWAAKKARPKRIKIKKPKPPPVPVESKKEKRRRKGKKEKVKRTKASLNYLMPGILKLCVPKHITEYYYPPYVPPFNYMPTINREEPLVVAPRKVEPIIVKKCFGDRELAGEYWRDFRFPPCSHGSLIYKISENVLKLSKPKEFPRIIHCEMPIPYEPPPRIQMTQKQWLWHLEHLNCLANPRVRLDPPEVLIYRKRRRLKALRDRILRLSKPRKSYKSRCKERWKITSSTLNAAASPRVTELAEPNKRSEPKCNDFKVKKGALNATATPRIEELAVPKKVCAEIGPLSSSRKYWRMEQNLRCALAMIKHNDEKKSTKKEEER